MTSHAENTKRIAKNTLMLYIRMLFSMLVSLYTSRVVLNTLGVEDYGIYNVVGGVVGMLGVLTASLGGASSRYITFDLGKKDIAILKKTFGNIKCIHFLLTILIFILGETVGLWFMVTQLHIPIERQGAALYVYQFSIFSAILSIISAPYTSVVIAHEKMSVFAYISMADVVLKLVAVYFLTIISYDKLIIYAFCYLLIQLIDAVAYYIYCVRTFEESKARMGYDKKLFKEIFAYSGWVLNGNLAVMGYTQGLNMLLNVFFGPVVNAARGIAVSVQTICCGFCNNIQTALNPQITKNYAQGNMSYVHSLLVKSSKFSLYILFIVILPLMFETMTVLKLWLGNVPDHTVVFLRIMLCISLFTALSGPVIVAVHATGKLRRFQLIEGNMLLLIVPIAYIVLKFFHLPPESVFIVHLCIELCTQYVRLKIVLPMIKMDLNTYWLQVVAPILRVLILSPILPFILYCLVKTDFLRFFVVCISCVISCLFFIYTIGCSRSEKDFIAGKIAVYIPKIKQ